MPSGTYVPSMSINDEDREIILKAIEAARHQPKLIDGTWWIWDFDSRVYINSQQTGSFEDSGPLNRILDDLKHRVETLEDNSSVKSAVFEFLAQEEYDRLNSLGSIDAQKIYFTYNSSDSETLFRAYVGKNVFATKLIEGTYTPTSFPSGSEFGEYIKNISGGIIDGQGNAELESLMVRSDFKTSEIIYNSITAQEGDSFFSDNGLVIDITATEDGTYTLTLQKRWDTDFIKFKEGDILYGQINDVIHTEGAFVSWMRVLSVDAVKNTINALLYPDDEVPSGKNHKPIAQMRIARRGNAINVDRQSYWYLSSTEEKCLVWLEGVDKPILSENNYYIILGRLKNLSFFDNLPINYEHSYIYARGGIFQDLFRVDFHGVPSQELVDRGFWSSLPDEPYLCEPSIAHTVWHYGCKWKCLKTGTTQEPKYAATDWAMLEGNPNFIIGIESTDGWVFDINAFKTTLYIKGMLYNQDITDEIKDADVSWTRDTGNYTEDAAWAALRANAGKELPLTKDDLGPDYTLLKNCKFKCTALLRDGQSADDYVTF